MATLLPHAQRMLDEYLREQPQLEQLRQRAYDILVQKLGEQGIELNAIESRVKAEDSLAGKLERKGDKYRQLSDVTDLVGIRVITFYTDDVDKVAAIATQLFKIDWNNSVDKRKSHKLTSFGYNSLHFICYLLDAGELSQIPFELQIRTALQHVWSAIEHDIGYKGAVELPPEYRRQFSRLAGMLELADDEFSRLRTTMTEYRRQVHSLVKSGHLDDIPLSTDSFNSFLELKPFDRLNQRIAAVNQAEIFPVSLKPFLPLLEQYHMETLGDIQRMIDENSDDAYHLAVSQLAVTDLDILSESVGLQNLCICYTLRQGGGRAGVLQVFDAINGHQASNEMLTDAIMKQVADFLPH